MIVCFLSDIIFHYHMHIDTFAIGLLLFSSILYANGYVQGALKVTIKSASDLPDEDGWWNLSDPYVVVTAYMYGGTCSWKPQSSI